VEGQVVVRAAAWPRRTACGRTPRPSRTAAWWSQAWLAVQARAIGLNSTTKSKGDDEERGFHATLARGAQSAGFQCQTMLRFIYTVPWQWKGCRMVLADACQMANEDRGLRPQKIPCKLVTVSKWRSLSVDWPRALME
jgi:hypothetical protein